jgi:peptide/nickel transport system substrate-binding protein
MTSTTTKGLERHPAAEMYAEECNAGKLSRREFLVRSTALGVSAAAAYSMIGMKPAHAQMATPPMGGSLRIQMEVRALKDPRTYDWSQMANITRGFLEYLIQYNTDGSFSGVLLESWEANEDASQYTLRLRPGVTWNNGDAFTAEDVAANFIGWCDSTVEGNSMATRMGALVDPDTGVAREGGIEVVDDLTVLITYPSSDITLVPGIADYPAAIQHRDLIGTNPQDHGVGTGAYRITNYEVGVQARLEKNPDHTYWGDAYLDEVTFIDLGQDPAAWFAGAEADEFDMTYETVGEFVDLFAAVGWEQSEVTTANTVVIRPNQNNAPYDNVMVRRAINMAVDPQVCLDLGINGQGTTAENHHVCPLHPEYAELPPITIDKEAAFAMLQESGHADHVFEISSIDDDYRRNHRRRRSPAARRGLHGGTCGDPGLDLLERLDDLSVQLHQLEPPGAGRADPQPRLSLGRSLERVRLCQRRVRRASRPGQRHPGCRCPPRGDDAAADDHAGRRRDAAALLAVALPALQAHGVVNAEMHPKYEINVHYLGVSAEDQAPGPRKRVRAFLFPASRGDGGAPNGGPRNEAAFTPANPGPHN